MDYSADAASALEMISDAGAAVTFTRTAQTSSVATGAVTNGATTTATGYAVQLPATSGTIQGFDNATEDAALATKRRRYLLVSTLGGFEPKFGDACTWAGETWTVMGCTPLTPAGTNVLNNVGLVET